MGYSGTGLKTWITNDLQIFKIFFVQSFLKSMSKIAISDLYKRGIFSNFVFY